MNERTSCNSWDKEKILYIIHSVVVYKDLSIQKGFNWEEIPYIINVEALGLELKVFVGAVW